MFLRGAHLRLFLAKIHGGCGGIPKLCLTALFASFFQFIPAVAGDLPSKLIVPNVRLSSPADVPERYGNIPLNPEGENGEYFYCRTGLCGWDLEQYYLVSAMAAIAFDGNLVVGGYFTSADGLPVQHLARWDGAAWHNLGGGVSGLYSNAILALGEYNGDLIVAGHFAMAGGVTARNIAAWDGASWYALGEGIDGDVNALCVYDGLLVAGGNFDSAGTVDVNDLAAWNGSEWIILPGFNSDAYVTALAIYDEKLIAAGNFDTPAGRIAAWDGVSWSSLGSGPNNGPQALAVYDSQLVAGGIFNNQIAVWNGSDWSYPGSGVTFEELNAQARVHSLSVYDGQLIVGGFFSAVDGIAAHGVAAWNGSTWSPLGSGMGANLYSWYNSVETLAEYDGLLVAGGAFMKEASAPGNRIAGWDGASWAEITSPETPFAFEIETISPYGGFPHGLPVSVEVTKIGGSENMYGFDFLIGFESEALVYNGVTPGPVFDSLGEYQWDYFAYRIDSTEECGGNCPSGLVRVVGVAELNDGSPPALSTDIADGTPLFHLNFIVTEDTSIECRWSNIEFYWIDCGDNGVALENGDLVVSDGVCQKGDYGWENVADPNAGLPGFLGVSDSCLSLGENPPERFVDFINGGVFMYCDPEPIDARGDINLNGISNEIADWVMFTNFMMHGLDAFGTHVEASIAMSDVNADGIVLSIEDLIYMYRIICGDANPYPAPPLEADTLRIIQDVSAKTVSVDYDDTLAAVYLVFNGDIIPQSLIDSTTHLCGYWYDGIHTFVLIQPNIMTGGECRKGLMAGPLFTYTDFGRLVQEGSDFRFTGAADYNNNSFSYSNPFVTTEILITGDYDGQASLSPQPLPRYLARIGESETVDILVWDFNEHDALDIDLTSLRVNDTIVPLSAVVYPPPPGFEDPVLEIIVPARSFINTYYFGPDTTGMPFPWAEIFDTLSTRLFVYEVSGDFADASSFHTIGNVTIFDQPATIPVPSGWTTIGEAVEVAQTNDTVLVDDGLYSGDGNRDISLSGKSLVIMSVNGPETTAIECGGSEAEPHRAFISTVAEESASIIEGFSIAGGYYENGGGISLVHSDLTIRNCIFMNCQATNGGAIYCHGASPTLEYCTFYLNAAQNGAAIYCWATSHPFIRSCTFTQNTGSQYGAVLYCYRSSPLIESSLMAFNFIGEAVYLLEHDNHPQFICSDIYGNDGGDWTGGISGQLGISGNISLDPMFCDTTQIDFHIDGMSPCAPNNNSCLVLIGAYDIGCGVRCGDINLSGRVDIGDVVFLVAFLFREGLPPVDLRATDLNANGEPDVGDAVILINFVFKNGPSLECPPE